jgi:hypothetical protein
LGAVAALGALWLLFAVSRAQLLSHIPIASASTASFVVEEAHTVQADIRDSGVFAKQIRHDRFANTPGNQLLTALRGKDVLLVFVESYGQVCRVADHQLRAGRRSRLGRGLVVLPLRQALRPP